MKLRAAAALCLLLAAGARAAEPDPATRPHVVLVMTDDQAWGDTGFNGLTKIRTPGLDALGAAGLRLDRYYAQQTCSPTRAAVLTGRHPNRMGVFWPGKPIRAEEVTAAQLARQAGYITGHFGKWHLNGVSGPGKVIADDHPLSPRRMGFDQSFSVSNYFERDWTFGRNGTPEVAKGDGSDVIVAEALKFLRQELPKGKPTFTLVWFGSPHVPHQPLPADLEAAGGSAYHGELIGVDRAVAALRAGLRELGVAENTLLWYSSDNGGTAKGDGLTSGGNAGFRGKKGDVWEGGIRVPALVEWPARIRPGVTATPAGVVDILPTLLDIWGIRPAREVPLDGVSLLPLFRGQEFARAKPLGFWQYGGKGANKDGGPAADAGPSAWSDLRFKLVKPAPGQWELYDLTVDRAESTNVADQHPEVVARMKAGLEEWQRSVIRSLAGDDYPPSTP